MIHLIDDVFINLFVLVGDDIADDKLGGIDIEEANRKGTDNRAEDADAGKDEVVWNAESDEGAEHNQSDVDDEA